MGVVGQSQRYYVGSDHNVLCVRDEDLGRDGEDGTGREVKIKQKVLGVTEGMALLSMPQGTFKARGWADWRRGG